MFVREIMSHPAITCPTGSTLGHTARPIIQTGRSLMAFGYPVLGLGGFVVAVLFGIRLAIGIMKSGRL